MPAGKSDWLSVLHKIMYGAMFWYFAQVSFNILAWNSDIYTHQLHIYTHIYICVYICNWWNYIHWLFFFFLLIDVFSAKADAKEKLIVFFLFYKFVSDWNKIITNCFTYFEQLHWYRILILVVFTILLTQFTCIRFLICFLFKLKYLLLILTGI